MPALKHLGIKSLKNSQSKRPQKLYLIDSNDTRVFDYSGLREEIIKRLPEAPIENCISLKTVLKKISLDH